MLKSTTKGKRLRLALPGACLVLIYCLLVSPCGAASVTANLNPTTVTVGDSAVLTLQFQGGQPSAVPAPPEVPGLRITPGQSLQSVKIVQGQYSATYSQEYSVTPLKTGDFQIPAFTANVAGQTVSSTPLALKAVAADPAQQLAVMQLEMLKEGRPLQQREFYVGEVLTVGLQVTIRNSVANGPNILQSFDQFSGMPVKGDGFSLIKTAHARQHQDNDSGSLVGGLVTSITAVRPGPLVIHSIEANLDLQLATGGPRRRDPFDPFGFFQQYQTRKIVLSAEPLTLSILPLPKENVPAGFGGAVGAFTISATAGPTNVSVGDPITIKISIAGRGNLESLALPEATQWNDFKSYPPTSKVDSDDPLGVSGTKTFEQVLIPQNPGAQAIPPVAFTFFDPSRKSYQTVASLPIPLIVRPAGAQAAPTVAASRLREEASSSKADILHIKPRMGTLVGAGPPLLFRPWFLGVQLLPLAGALAALFWRRRTDALANNPKARRQRQVAALVKTGLDELPALAQTNNSETFFATLFRLLQEQMGERLDLPASAITEAVIDDRLRPKGISPELLSELVALFQACNQARYAPTHSTQELADYVPRVQAAFRKLSALKL